MAKIETQTKFKQKFLTPKKERTDEQLDLYVTSKQTSPIVITWENSMA